MKNARDFLALFAAQMTSYALLTYDFRVLAQGRIAATIIADALACSFGFFVIRRIATMENSRYGFLGYLSGSVLGTWIGMVITK